ncbi:hypothetical protein M426DRAFT_137624 [Hypoxylon sp. CI-4A]|nr:hypothetical protein M426DRAFT_137624 [Hypoxylon sp. CI-4A]
MRANVPTLGILACLTGLVVAADIDSGAGEDRTGTSTQPSQNAVISVQYIDNVFVQGTTDKVITYERGTGIDELHVDNITLMRYGDNETIAQGQTILPNSNSTDTTTESELDLDDRVVGRREEDTFKFLITNQSVTLPTRSDLYAQYGSNVGKPLYLKFQWVNSTSSGSSYSPLLAVTYNTTSDTATARLAIQRTGKERGPAYTEIIGGPSDNDASPSTSTDTPSADTSATAETTSRKGLSGGAIAGIAVGCSIAGLIIIGLTIWLLFFRRRRTNNSTTKEQIRSSDFAADSGVAAIMSEKEVAATGVSETTPRDARRRSLGTVDADADADVDSPPYASPLPTTPAFAAATTTTGSQTDVASAGRSSSMTRTSTPQGFQSRYAHLIEEGMTEEQIRQLEEEERHLDAAIEDVGRNSRAAHQS